MAECVFSLYFWLGKWGSERCDVFQGHIQKAEFQNYGCLTPLPQSNAFPLTTLPPTKL